MFILHFIFILADIEQECFDIINKDRAEKSLKPFERNNCLDEAAKIQAQHQATTNQCSHTGPAGLEDFTKRFDKANYKNSPTGKRGENVLQAQESSSAQEIFQQWKNSPHHYENMCNAEYNESGIACSISADKKSYWAQVFGTSGNGGDPNKKETPSAKEENKNAPGGKNQDKPPLDNVPPSADPKKPGENPALNQKDAQSIQKAMKEAQANPIEKAPSPKIKNLPGKDGKIINTSSNININNVSNLPTGLLKRKMKTGVPRFPLGGGSKKPRLIFE